MKAKKLYSGVVCVIAIMLFCAVGLIGCGGGDKPPVHIHDYRWVTDDNSHRLHCSGSGCPAPDINAGAHDYGESGVCICCKAKPVAGHNHAY